MGRPRFARRSALVLVLALVGSTAWAQLTRRGRPAPGRPAGRWLGQDGHDLVGPSPAPAPAPSGVRDIHIALRGLPAGAPIKGAKVTALGGSEWVYNGPYGPWRAEVVQPPGATTAELYLEPTQAEDGRPFQVVLTFDGGRSLTIDVSGGRADPNLRVPGAALQVAWVGQDGQDRAAAEPAVGPDGGQDVHLTLAGLAPQVEVRALTVEAPGLPGWAFGSNPERRHNAELIRRADDRARADLYFQPDRDLAGAMLTLLVAYANGKSDQATLVASHADPALRMPAPPPVRLAPTAVSARWVGQDGRDVTGPGDVHIVLDGLPRDRVVAALALSDPVGTCWAHRASERVAFQPEPYSEPLAFHRHPTSPGRADLFLPPVRDESGGTMTLRLVFGDGTAGVVRFPGGACDPGRRAGPGPSGASITARPGADLHALAERYGTIRLVAGTYRLERPLVLDRPVTIDSEPGATLVFAQPAGARPWTAAIKVRAGHTTLQGFAVRFAGPVRWREEIEYGPAVIGTQDNCDGPRPGPFALADVVLTRLDLEAPPASRPGSWEEAPRLLRLVTAANGRVEANTLKGGPIEVTGGPWLIADNDSRGTVPDTTSPTVIAGHNTHDLTVRNNRVRAGAPAGKTWRFLVLTGHGCNDAIEANRVEGVGPREDDKVPSSNSPEIILTESYRVHFEGHPLAISGDGRVLQIPEPQGEPARAGACAAVLTGPEAGTWRRVVQAIDRTTYLVDPPLPPGDCALSIATGFVEETVRGNTIDCRGTTLPVNLVLVGNHYGTKVLDNVLIGAGDAFKLAACGTESPGLWGWTHSPFVGVTIEGNTIEDSASGGTLTVDHGPAIKSSGGRVYLSATCRRNTCAWTGQEPADRPGFTIGDPTAPDPGELLVRWGENRARVPAGTAPGVCLLVHAATFNGQPLTGRRYTLPAEPAAPR